MNKEIEHKHLVISHLYKNMAIRVEKISQGYLSRIPERVVRVRIKDDKGFLTIKGKNHGDTREEYEYEIPLKDALYLLKLCEEPIIEKTRYIVPFEGFTWEVDDFSSPKKMVIAEIELRDSLEKYKLPPFIGEDVTGDPQYYNSNL